MTQSSAQNATPLVEKEYHVPPLFDESDPLLFVSDNLMFT